MIKKIQRILVTLAASLALFAPAAMPAVAGAQGDIRGSLCSGARLGSAGTPHECLEDYQGTDVNSIVDFIVDTFSWIVGIVSVIMIIYGGFRYITSGGDSSKVTSAKNTIVYAIIGLVIVALAQFIVNFVVNRVVSSS